MEGINPVWFTACLFGLVIGGVLLLLMLVALVVWLSLRTRGFLVVFYVSLGCLVCAGAFVALSLALMGSSWP
jgi:hypothetical protein